MNKSQEEKKINEFHAVFRVYVNDVKPLQNFTGRSPLDHFLDPQSMPRLFFITINRWLIQTLLLLVQFQQLTMGVGWLRTYQNDYVIDN